MPDAFDFGVLKNSLISLDASETDVSISNIKFIGKCNFIEQMIVLNNSRLSITDLLQFNNFESSLLELQISNINLSKNQWEKLSECKVIKKIKFENSEIYKTENVNDLKYTLTDFNFHKCSFHDFVNNPEDDLKNLFKYINISIS